jgi:hypothetical protein
MNPELVKELLRSFENKLHDQLMVIQDILTMSKANTEAGDISFVKKNLEAVASHVNSLEEYAMGEVRTLAYNHDMLEKRVELAESTLRTMVETLQTVNTTLGSLQKRMDDERPVEAVEAEVEIEETQEAALNADTDVVATETKAKKTLAKAVEELEEEEEEEEPEEEEADDEEEEEVPDLESFTYKKKTFARDSENNVYSVDAEGAADISEVIGIWNPVTKTIDPVPQEEETPELEAFEYQKKTYCRDAENNVYPVDADGCADISEIIGIWNPKTKKIDRVPNA